jgi:ATP synthase protein I
VEGLGSLALTGAAHLRHEASTLSEPPEHRLPWAVAMEWASRVTTIALEMALPPIVGYWLDRRFGSAPALAIVGAVLGFCAGMLHLTRIAQANKNKGKRGRPDLPPLRDDELSGRENEGSARNG